MSLLDELLDHLVAGDEDKAKQLFHEIVVNQSKIEWNKKQLPEGDLIPLPQNSVSVDADATDYDFMRLGRNMANIATTEPSDNNMGDQDIMLNFFGGDKEAKHMIKNLKRLGYKVGNISGYQDHNFDPDSEQDMVVDPEDDDEVKEIKESVDKSALEAWHSKYNNYEGSNGDKLAEGFLMSYIDTGILSDGAEINEYAKIKEKYGSDAITEKGIEAFFNEMPITKAMHMDYMKIMGVSEADEEDARQAAKMLGYDLIEQDASVQEAVDKSALKAWYDKYSKYQSNNYDNLVFGMIKAWTDTGILSDAYEENEYAAVVDKFGDDKADSMDHDQVLKMMPISKAMQDDITKIMGQWQGEETMNKVDDMLQDLGLLEY